MAARQQIQDLLAWAALALTMLVFGARYAAHHDHTPPVCATTEDSRPYNCQTGLSLSYSHHRWSRQGS